MSFVADSTYQTLQNLYKSYLDSRAARENSYGIKQNRDQLSQEISELRKLIKNEEKRLDSLLEEKRQIMGEGTEKTEESIDAVYTQEEAELRKKMEEDLQDNAEKLAQRLDELYGDHADEYLKLTEQQEKALVFAQRRASITELHDSQLNDLNDAIAQEELDDQNDQNKLYAQKNEILKKYEPDLKKYLSQIDQIKGKYEPDLERLSEHQQQLISVRDQQIVDCQNRQNSIKSTIDGQIKILKRQQKKAKKEFDSQIARAAAENRATTRLKTSQINENNRFEHEISETQRKGTLEIEKLTSEISSINISYNKLISADKQEYDHIISRMNKELKNPGEAYTVLKNKQDDEVGKVEKLMSERKEKKNRAVGNLKEKVAQSDAEYNSKIGQLDGEMREYAMSGETCLNEKTLEVYQEFVGLEGHLAGWQKTKDSLGSSLGKKNTEKIRSKQKEFLHNLNYDALLVETQKAEKLAETANPLLRNYKNVVGIIAIFCTFVIFICLFQVKLSPIASVILPALILIAAFIGLKTAVTKSLQQYCRAEILATEYRTFGAVSQRSNELTVQAEFESLKKIGDELYIKHQGPEEAKKKAALREKDIRADFERALGIIKAKATAEKNQLANMLVTKDQDLRKKEQEIHSVSAKKNELMRKKEGMDQRLSDCEKKLAQYLKAAEEYQSNCKEIEKMMPDLKPKLAEFDGPLRDRVYLIQEKDSRDENGDKPIYSVEHEKKPVIVLYDLSKKEDSTSRNVQIEMINEIIRDFSNAFSWVNLSYILEQAIVQPFDASSFKEQGFVKKCHIKSIGTDIDDIKSFLSQCENDRNRIAESGRTLDELNRSNFESGSEPQPYHITYLAFKPEQMTGKLNDKVAQLLPHCDRYGFLPIFICEMNAWKQGTENGKEGNLYREIKNYEYSCMLSYDGELYKEL